MHVSILTSGAKPKVERCTSLCNLFHCPMCLTFKPTRWSKLQSHLEAHKKGGISFKDKIICRCGLKCREQGHYHCPGCNKTIVRRTDMTRHLEVCQDIMTAASPEQTSRPIHKDTAAVSSSVLPSLDQLDGTSSSSPSAEQQSTTATPLSTVLQATVSPTPDLTASEQDIAAVSSSVLPAATENRGPRYLKRVKCPHCNHTFYKKNMAKHIWRKHREKSKDITVKDHFESVCVHAANGISEMQKTTHESSVPIHVQNRTCGRVHEVECDLGEWRKHHLMAVRSGLTLQHSNDIRSVEHCTEMATEELIKEEVLSEMVELKFFCGYPPVGDNLEWLVGYLYSQKKIPDDLPDDLVEPKALTDHLTQLHPTETVCTNCLGSVHLQSSTRITENAKIISMNGVLENVSTYFRCCPHCQMVYRYQEWKDGLHNFDDHTILTLELCLYIRYNLQNDVSVSKVIDALESLRKVKYPARDTILHAYCHFEALKSHPPEVVIVLD